MFLSSQQDFMSHSISSDTTALRRNPYHTHLFVLPVCRSHSTMFVSSEPLYNKLSSGCHWTQFTPPLWPPSWQRENNIANPIGMLLYQRYYWPPPPPTHTHKLQLKVSIWFWRMRWQFTVTNTRLMLVPVPVCGSSISPVYSAALPSWYCRWALCQLLCPSPTGLRSPPPVPPRISSSSSEASPKTHISDVTKNSTEHTYLYGLYLNQRLNLSQLNYFGF